MIATPCRTWTASNFASGYGRVKREGRQQYVHRWVWRLMHGPIPDGLFVLHHCDNPPCYRLDHLYLGTKKDNRRDQIERGRDPMLAKTHCPQGHAYTPENTYTAPPPRAWRQCVTCRASRRRRSPSS